MMTEFQLETTTTETAAMSPIAEASSAEMMPLGEDELDLCPGGRNAGSSTSGFFRNRMAMTKGTFAGPEGAGSFSSVMTEETGSFSQENWDIFQ
ncbi:MAG: hypothetical protein HC780_22930 [Leptolyngbyaceae cyanobacterium CSU_1_3]|nr:hypothetical protein [Leptolyngbyaceae cyanobacterium CSU_1_3]